MKIKCPACSKVLAIPESAAGKVVKCPCGKQLRAPGAAAAPAQAAPAGGAAKPQPAAKQPAAKRPAAQPAGGGFGGFDPAMFDELTDDDLKKPPPGAGVKKTAAKAPTGNAAKLLNQYAGTRDAHADMLIGPKVKGELASIGQRIAGALVDGVFYSVFIFTGVGIMFAMLAGGGEEPDPSKLMTGYWILIACSFIPTIINAALISMSGQTVGKKVVGTRIVSQLTGAPAGFLNGFLIRNVGFGFFTGLPFIGFFIAVADICYLFTADHETLHDKLANTMVVRA